MNSLKQPYRYRRKLNYYYRLYSIGRVHDYAFIATKKLNEENKLTMNRGLLTKWFPKSNMVDS